ncbi:conserved protein, unknown function, partial [Hepatocystis sp. ex Piliocolobus tephrosceles]
MSKNEASNNACEQNEKNIKINNYDNISKEQQEFLVGVPCSWEYVENSKGWFIIETSKNYKFYFNKKTNEKTWDCPKEIEKHMTPATTTTTNNNNNNNNTSWDNIRETSSNDVVRNTNGDQCHMKIEENNKSNDVTTKVEEYKQLLIEKKINKFSIYEKVIDSILYDSRYTNIPKDLRKELFYKIIKEIDNKKDVELKRLIEGFQLLLNKKKEEFKYPYKLSDAIKCLEGKKEYIGTQSKEWIDIRNKLLKKVLDKKFKEKQKEVSEKLEKALFVALQNENNKGIILQIKNSLIKKKKYDILTKDEKNKIYEQVIKNISEKKKKRTFHNNNMSSTIRRSNSNNNKLYVYKKRDEDYYHYNKGKDTLTQEYVSEINKKKRHNLDEENIFLSLLHEKVKHVVIESCDSSDSRDSGDN